MLTLKKKKKKKRYYEGRGAFESMGAGLDMIPSDIAFKVRTNQITTIVYLNRYNSQTLLIWIKNLVSLLKEKQIEILKALVPFYAKRSTICKYLADPVTHTLM